MVLLLTLDHLWCSSEPVQLLIPTKHQEVFYWSGKQDWLSEEPTSPGQCKEGWEQCQGEDDPSLAMRRAQLPTQHQPWPLQSVFVSAEVGSGSSSGTGFCGVDSLKEKPLMAFSSSQIFNGAFRLLKLSCQRY